MNTRGRWRPPQHIRVVVLGLVVENGRFLAGDVPDDDGSLKGLRPLGGAVEFGETREQALHREFLEETGSTIAITGEWMLFENIFEHGGTTGHEIIFAAPVRILDPSFPRHEPHAFMDSMPTVARWHALDAIEAAGLPVFPAGILGALRLCGT
jgi:8-oxo-dGTP pyrophosphatase MutT (NUDIX family)